MSDTLDWNASTIAEFRANDGRVGGVFAGAPLVLVHHRGRKSRRVSRSGFVGGYDALASGSIIVWPWPISQSFSYSAGGISPQAEWSLSLLYQEPYS